MIKEVTEKLKRGVHQHGAVNIVCLGDSVTQGAFENGHCEASVSYSAKLAQMLQYFYQNSVVNVINSGIGGTTAQFAATRLERDVLCYHPDLVIVMFGVNDFGDINVYLESLAKIFDKMKEAGIPVIYATEHMMNTYVAPNTADIHLSYAEKTAEVQKNGTMDKVFSEGCKVAEEHGAYVCDIYSKWKMLNESGVDTTSLLANGINHPKPEMHTFVAYELMRMMLF